MERLLTTTGKRVGYISWDLSDNETSSTVTLRVIPAENHFLKSSPVDGDVQVMARKGIDAFVDIGATPIDLSSLPAEVPVNYEFKTVANSPLTDVRRVAMFLSVATQSAADWGG